jgi:hypothetical protein
MVAEMPVEVGGVSTPRALVPPRGELHIPLLVSIPHLLRTTSFPLPKIRFFRPAQPSRVNRSVLYAWPRTHTTPGSAAPRPFGTDPRPDVTRTRRGASSPLGAPPCAATGTIAEAVHPVPTNSGTNVQGVETRITELRDVLELRRNQALTPYRVDAWEKFLHQCNLHVKYPNLVFSLRNGFNAGIRSIVSTYTPPNNVTLHQHPNAYQNMVSNEFGKGRYIGPCTR